MLNVYEIENVYLFVIWVALIRPVIFQCERDAADAASDNKVSFFNASLNNIKMLLIREVFALKVYLCNYIFWKESVCNKYKNTLLSITVSYR